MMYTRNVKYICLSLFMLLPSLSSAQIMGGSGSAVTTPSEYEVTVKRVEFQKQGGGYVTFFDGNGQINLGDAEVSPNTIAGNIGQFETLPQGTYTRIRVTIGDSFKIKGAATSNGTGCYTTADNGVKQYTVGSGAVQVEKGTTVSTDFSSQRITMPTDVSGSFVSDKLAAANMELISGGIRFSVPVQFTVDSTGGIPNIRIDFDVADKLEVYYDNTDCVVFPLPPTMRVTTPSGNKLFDAGL